MPVAIVPAKAVSANHAADFETQCRRSPLFPAHVPGGRRIIDLRRPAA